jgi:hypothetical protein
MTTMSHYYFFRTWTCDSADYALSLLERAGVRENIKIKATLTPHTQTEPLNTAMATACHCARTGTVLT